MNYMFVIQCSNNAGKLLQTRIFCNKLTPPLGIKGVTRAGEGAEKNDGSRLEWVKTSMTSREIISYPSVKFVHSG